MVSCSMIEHRNRVRPRNPVEELLLKRFPEKEGVPLMGERSVRSEFEAGEEEEKEPRRALRTQRRVVGFLFFRTGRTGFSP